ncbi:hypothetical protein CPJCM30710_07100 [Clostridium polyendosporum]|uniref:HMA domain-containing protein n=1 Tax=Clostridium polyendosporum TaxID=69208 RepID=A0A919RXE6_9CLOT|nr:cation transporter [Clostridium polyendosporum]GIM28044.1 hypothetical protein CPJCM30710_07100 [Clostridium polyendosporum]
MKRKVFIEGMSCGHCVNHVTNALSELDGISSVEVNLEGKYAIVEGSASEQEIKAIIEDTGYDVTKFENL